MCSIHPLVSQFTYTKLRRIFPCDELHGPHMPSNYKKRRYAALKLKLEQAEANRDAFLKGSVDTFTHVDDIRDLLNLHAIDCFDLAWDLLEEEQSILTEKDYPPPSLDQKTFLQIKNNINEILLKLHHDLIHIDPKLAGRLQKKITKLNKIPDQREYFDYLVEIEQLALEQAQFQYNAQAKSTQKVKTKFDLATENNIYASWTKSMRAEYIRFKKETHGSLPKRSTIYAQRALLGLTTAGLVTTQVTGRKALDFIASLGQPVFTFIGGTLIGENIDNKVKQSSNSPALLIATEVASQLTLTASDWGKRIGAKVGLKHDNIVEKIADSYENAFIFLRKQIEKKRKVSLIEIQQTHALKKETKPRKKDKHKELKDLKKAMRAQGKRSFAEFYAEQSDLFSDLEKETLKQDIERGKIDKDMAMIVDHLALLHQDAWLFFIEEQDELDSLFTADADIESFSEEEFRQHKKRLAQLLNKLARDLAKVEPEFSKELLAKVQSMESLSAEEYNKQVLEFEQHLQFQLEEVFAAQTKSLDKQRQMVRMAEYRHAYKGFKKGIVAEWRHLKHSKSAPQFVKRAVFGLVSVGLLSTQVTLQYWSKHGSEISSELLGAVGATLGSIGGGVAGGSLGAVAPPLAALAVVGAPIGGFVGNLMGTKVGKWVGQVSEAPTRKVAEIILLHRFKRDFYDPERRALLAAKGIKSTKKKIDVYRKTSDILADQQKELFELDKKQRQLGRTLPLLEERLTMINDAVADIESVLEHISAEARGVALEGVEYIDIPLEQGFEQGYDSDCLTRIKTNTNAHMRQLAKELGTVDPQFAREIIEDVNALQNAPPQVYQQGIEALTIKVQQHAQSIFESQQLAVKDQEEATRKILQKHAYQKWANCIKQEWAYVKSSEGVWDGFKRSFMGLTMAALVTAQVTDEKIGRFCLKYGKELGMVIGGIIGGAAGGAATGALGAAFPPLAVSAIIGAPVGAVIGAVVGRPLGKVLGKAIYRSSRLLEKGIIRLRQKIDQSVAYRHPMDESNDIRDAKYSATPLSMDVDVLSEEHKQAQLKLAKASILQNKVQSKIDMMQQLLAENYEPCLIEAQSALQLGLDRPQSEIDKLPDAYAMEEEKFRRLQNSIDESLMTMIHDLSKIEHLEKEHIEAFVQVKQQLKSSDNPKEYAKHLEQLNQLFISQTTRNIALVQSDVQLKGFQLKRQQIRNCYKKWKNSVKKEWHYIKDSPNVGIGIKRALFSTFMVSLASVQAINTKFSKLIKSATNFSAGLVERNSYNLVASPVDEALNEVHPALGLVTKITQPIFSVVFKEGIQKIFKPVFKKLDKNTQNFNDSLTAIQYNEDLKRNKRRFETPHIIVKIKHSTKKERTATVHHKTSKYSKKTWTPSGVAKTVFSKLQSKTKPIQKLFKASKQMAYNQQRIQFTHQKNKAETLTITKESMVYRNSRKRQMSPEAQKLAQFALELLLQNEPGANIELKANNKNELLAVIDILAACPEVSPEQITKAEYIKDPKTLETNTLKPKHIQKRFSQVLPPKKRVKPTWTPDPDR